MIKYKSLFLSWFGKRILLRMARLCLYHARGKWCWICGAHCGMGPIWAGRMTCWSCHREWSYFHNDKLIVDWYGLGRIRNNIKNKCFK